MPGFPRSGHIYTLSPTASVYPMIRDVVDLLKLRVYMYIHVYFSLSQKFIRERSCAMCA